MRWLVKSKFDPSKNIVDQLLENRGIVEKEEKEKFLRSQNISDIPNFFTKEFKNSVVKAKDTILKAVKENQPILVFGDYDADGICATSILYSTIKNELDYENVSYFIPNRFDHGYGMSMEALEEILDCYQDKKVLFVTVDTGITAVEEINYLKEKGHLVVITDHHQKPDKLPNADFIVWNDGLVGSSISWVLSKALGSKDPNNLAYAAIATVTDLQQVLGVNRIIVKKGLEIINRQPPLSIKMLLEVSGKSVKEVSTYDLGWLIGPRLNAAGRLKDASESISLLLSDKEKEAREYAQRLNEVNAVRQDKTVEMYEMAALENEESLPKIIFSRDENYHEGIIGLVAAKLVQKYYRPSVVISLSDGFGKGSVRSIPGVDIIKMLRNFEDLFESLGGHPMAAGFSIKKDNISELEKRMLELAELEIDESILDPQLDIDLKIPVEIVNIDLLEELEKMKPFGLGNEEPVFVSEGLGILDVSVIGKESTHLLIKFYSGGKHYKGVFFNGSGWKEKLKLGDNVSVVYHVRRNEFNGKVYVDLIVKDMVLA